MCGRFTLTHDINAVAQAFGVPVPASLQTGARYNVAPTQNVVTVLSNGSTHLDMLRWGLIPSWAKDESVGSKMINARAETLAEKPSFKRLLRSRRCLIAADGFYEWKKEQGGKTPMYITMKDGEIFALAGLWDTWKNADGEQIRTCTIITTEPNELVTRSLVGLDAARRKSIGAAAQAIFRRCHAGPPGLTPGQQSAI